MTAKVRILFEGYLSRPDAENRTASTVGFVRDDGVIVVVDPGLVPGLWYIAATVASALRASRDPHGSRLNEEHFEFRGGVTTRAAEAQAARTA